MDGLTSMPVAEIEGATVVMLGSFNPAIFQPHWLEAQKLIRPEEAEHAKITIIQNEVADFSTEWFQLQALTGRFLISSGDPSHFSPLRDLASAIFSLLSHTPITGLGIHRHFHFRLSSKKAWNQLGHLLAPKEPWHSIMDHPGLRELTIEGSRRNLSGGILRIKVQPSIKVEFGIFMEVHEEFVHSIEEDSSDTPWVVTRLNEHWDPIMAFAAEASSHILGFAEH
jgi:hypothetical protein